MPNIRDVVPASVRKPVVNSSRFAQGLTGRTQRLNFDDLPAECLFARLPGEPDDARLTGVTRSLNRRLLALNLRKTPGMTKQVA